MNAALRTGLRFSAWMLALALVALPVVAVVNGWIGSERWPLRTLRVNDGLQRVDQQALRAAVLPFARRGFFAVPLADAQAAVAALPWVDRAEVRKRWPDVLDVRIEEHVPFARWGDERLLSVQGRLFPLVDSGLPDGLPALDGPDARTADVVSLYNEARELFGNVGIGVGRVALDDRGSWSLALDNGVDVVVGSQEATLRLRRFARMLPQLMASRAEPLQRADLRYTNGFALVWAEPGSREPGAGARRGDAPSPDLAEAHAAPRFPIPFSRFPIPGFPV